MKNYAGDHRITAAISCCFLLGNLGLLHAQVPQIPSLQVCNGTNANGSASVIIDARKSGNPTPNTGTFTVAFGTNVTCNPPVYPAGQFTIKIDMTDTNGSVNKGIVTSTTIEQVTTTGSDTPTLYMNGRCSFPPSSTGSGQQQGCRYWLMIADNVSHTAGTTGGTPEVIGFLIINSQGARVAYGTGPVSSGHITVKATSN